LDAIAQVYRQQAWQLDTLSLRDGKMEMRGQSKDIEQLNRIQESLQKALHRDVHIVDTNMANQHVSFRMSWGS